MKSADSGPAHSLFGMPPPDGGRAAFADGQEVAALTLSLAAVQTRQLTWLWPGRLPLGKVALLDGDPGLGKSLVTIDLAARVTRAASMPDGATGEILEPSGVVLISAEDDPCDTIRPRADAAGMDCSRVRLLTGVSEMRTDEGGDRRAVRRSPTLADIDALRQAIQEVRAKLVIVDPLMAFLGGDAHRDQDVRQALAPLAGLAAETGAAILVVRHLNKSGGGNPIYRGGGSIGIIGAARAGLMVARDPDDPSGERRILAMTKSNLATQAPSLAYRVTTTNGVARIEWLGHDTHSADTLLSAPADPEERSSLTEACEWLKGQISNGEEMAKTIQDRARQDGISGRTLERAKARLGVIAHKSGRSGKWFWGLPEGKAANTAQHSQLGGLLGVHQPPPTIPPCNYGKNAKTAKAAKAANGVGVGDLWRPSKLPAESDPDRFEEVLL